MPRVMESVPASLAAQLLCDDGGGHNPKRAERKGLTSRGQQTTDKLGVQEEGDGRRPRSFKLKTKVLNKVLNNETGEIGRTRWINEMRQSTASPNSIKYRYKSTDPNYQIHLLHSRRRIRRD
jgi:hypothetical protein